MRAVRWTASPCRQRTDAERRMESSTRPPIFTSAELAGVREPLRLDLAQGRKAQAGGAAGGALCAHGRDAGFNGVVVEPLCERAVATAAWAAPRDPDR